MRVVRLSPAPKGNLHRLSGVKYNEVIVYSERRKLPVAHPPQQGSQTCGERAGGTSP